MGVLDDKAVVVTGASRGLGEAMAVGFSREGAQLVLAARTAGDLERVAGRCKEAGAASVTALPTDITDEKQVQRLVDETLAAIGKIDAFVANAGTSYANLTDKRYRELVSYDLDVFEQIFKVNVIGTWLCVRAALNAMSRGGSLILIGSETGRLLYPGAGVYSLTKACLDAMTLLASREVAGQGVRVNCLSPGGMVNTHLFGPNKMPDFLKQRPEGYLEPDVMVPAAVWLASDRSADISGAFVSAKEFNSRPLEETLAALSASHH